MKSSPQHSRPKFNAIALAEANSIHRRFVDATKIWLQKQACQNNFSVDYIKNTEKIDDAFLSHYQLFVQLDYPPYGWTPKAAAAFTKYIKQEEWYTYDKSPRPNVHVLGHVDESTYSPDNPTKMGGDYAGIIR